MTLKRTERKTIYLVPCPNSGYHRGCAMLGKVHICQEAKAWLEANFPNGGSLAKAWANCPRADWLDYFAFSVSDRCEPGNDGMLGIDPPAESDSADAYRRKMPFSRVRAMLRQMVR